MTDDLIPPRYSAGGGVNLGSTPPGADAHRSPLPARRSPGPCAGSSIESGAGDVLYRRTAQVLGLLHALAGHVAHRRVAAVPDLAPGPRPRPGIADNPPGGPKVTQVTNSLFLFIRMRCRSQTALFPRAQRRGQGHLPHFPFPLSVLSSLLGSLPGDLSDPTLNKPIPSFLAPLRPSLTCLT